ncbi:hypothetical protein V8C86DRAFT_2655470 [Haematococcus lacustris]
MLMTCFRSVPWYRPLLLWPPLPAPAAPIFGPAAWQCHIMLPTLPALPCPCLPAGVRPDRQQRGQELAEAGGQHHHRPLQEWRTQVKAASLPGGKAGREGKHGGQAWSESWSGKSIECTGSAIVAVAGSTARVPEY